MCVRWIFGDEITPIAEKESVETGKSIPSLTKHMNERGLDDFVEKGNGSRHHMSGVNLS